MNQTTSLRAGGEAISLYIKNHKDCRVASLLAMINILPA